MAKKTGHSPKFETVKHYYDLYVESDGKRGWSLEKVHNAVVKNWITPEEYEEITGEPYEQE